MADDIDSGIEEVQATFGGVSVLRRGDGAFVRIASVTLPRGCRPERTEVLVRLQGADRPQIWVRPGLVGPHGASPRSCSNVLVEGETWMQFSYQFPWEWSDGLVRFVGAALRRFEKHE